MPVISIGNLVAGGTGKTVLVDYLIEKLKPTHKVGVACRGYRAGPDGLNDEMRLLMRHHEKLVCEANPKRRLAVQACIDKGCDVVLMDDGFQHRKVARDLNVVILDATDPYSQDLIPRGRRREPIASLKRADVIVLSHANCVEPNDMENLRNDLTKRFDVVVAVGQHALQNPKNADGDELPVGPVHMVAGIGQPQHFEQGLTSLGYDVKAKTLPGDHNAPSAEGMKALESSKWPIVCTEKDIVKQSSASAWYVAEVKWEFLEGEELFGKKIKDVIKNHA